MTDSDVTPGISRAEYVDRRRRLAEHIPPRSLSIFPSNPTRYMSEDVPYLYHHNTDLMYVCGITEPGSLLLAEKADGPQVHYTLYVDPRDPERELWDGPLCGTGDEVAAYFGVDRVRSKEHLHNHIVRALPDFDTFHMDHTINPSISAFWTKLDPSAQRHLQSKWKRSPSPKSFVMPLRLIKTQSELHLMRQASRIMSEALNETMAQAGLSARTNTVHEKYIEALIEFGCKKRGSPRLAFPSVVASGTNGTILHYMSNNRPAQQGDFVMVDAGCEVHGYCSDISRSWPVSGRFTGPQKDLYQLALSAQKKCIAGASEDAMFGTEPVSMDNMHGLCVHELTDGLLQLGFMKGHSLQSAVATGEYAKYYPHATGHYLGMDVHDTHQVPKSLKLQRDMVVTVEPGIYCPVDDPSVPPAFRGLGMRIEDDVVVGAGANPPEVLSRHAVKEVADIESIVGSAR